MVNQGADANVSAVLEKTALPSSQSQDNCTEKPGVVRNLVNRIEGQLGGIKPS
jgi:hypothetical protein